MSIFPYFNPLEQFEIFLLVPLSLFSFNLGLTNLNFLLVNVVLLLFFGLYLNVVRNKLLISSRAFEVSFYELYQFLIQLTFENLALKGQFYVPLLLVLFIYILSFNLLGRIPYVFTVTSHLIFTFILAFSLFRGINIIALRTNKINFLNLFLPKGVPFFIVPLLLVIELISYNVKVFTLAIRLFTNRTSGHTLLKIVASFAWIRFRQGGMLSVVAWIPSGLLIILIWLEIGIAFLQAYVFSLLILVYLNDVINIH